MAGLCGSVLAAVAANATITGIRATSVEGVDGDLFDGVSVTDYSPLHSVSTNAGSVVDDWFTAPNATELLFDEGSNVTKFIEFNTASAVTLRSVVIKLDGDANPDISGRSIDNIKFYASTDAGTVMNNLVADIAVDSDYIMAYGSLQVQVDIDFDAVSGQYFRFEFNQTINGARIREIDAYSTPDVVTTATRAYGISQFRVEGVNGDLFDGATVTANSALHGASSGTADWFSSPNTTELLFADSGSNATKFIEFNTASAVEMESIVVMLSGDFNSPYYGRSTDHIKFYAGTSPATVTNNLIADIPVDSYYMNYEGRLGWVRIPINFSSMTNQYFRLEFGQVDNGIRIREIDAYGTPFVLPNATATFQSTNDMVWVEGAGDDLFEGAAISAHSPQHPASDIPAEYWFISPNVGFELLFDDSPTNRWESIDFSIGTIAEMDTVDVWLRGEHTYENITVRRVETILFYAGTTPEEAATNLVADIPVARDYRWYGADSEAVRATIHFNAPVVGRYFRIEFEQPNIVNGGPRILEIDGYGTPETIYQATIVGWSSYSPTVMKMVVDAPSTPIYYYPKAKDNLVIGTWGSVAHSDNPAGPFATTNLSYSTAEGPNEVIYVEVDANDAKFFGIGRE